MSCCEHCKTEKEKELKDCGEMENAENGKHITLFENEKIFFLIKLALSVIFLTLAVTLSVGNVLKTVFFVCAALVVGYPLLINSVRNILKLDFFDENFLMLIASVVAFVIGEELEGVLVVLLFSVGEFLEDVATDNSRDKIVGLAKLKSQFVTVVTDGKRETVLPESVAVGSIIYVKKGERIPIDGVLLSDGSELDMKAVTGESKLFYPKKGDRVYGGAVNVGDAIEIRTEKEYKDSTVERIIALVEESAERKSKSQKFITKFAKIYTPVVIAITVLVSVLPPLIFNYDFGQWVYKGLALLIVSCPCALVISVPLCYFLGIGSLAKRGVLVKGGNYIDNLSDVSCAVFDKTGTITNGNFVIAEVISKDGYSKNDILKIACSLESGSTHPIARAIVNGYDGEVEKVNDLREKSGDGVYGIINGKLYSVGRNVEDNSEGSSVGVFREGDLIGVIKLVDEIKTDAAITISELKKIGIKKTVVISGDREKTVKSVVEKVKIDSAYYEMMPEDKLNTLLQIIKTNKKGKVLFCGDGVNDSPSIAAADVGVAMGALGSESAIENSDVVITDDSIIKIPMAIKKARIIRRTAITNVVLSIAVKVAIMAVSVFVGIPLWLATFGDVGIMLLAVLNALTIGIRK